MRGAKLIIEYAHDSADVSGIDLALSRPGRRPDDGAWRPAFRDTIDGALVVWIRVQELPAAYDVWLRDRNGARLADSVGRR